MNDSPDRDVVVFAEALQLPPGKRSAYLERACAADEELRQRVERLLKAHDHARKQKGVVFMRKDEIAKWALSTPNIPHES